MSKNKILIIVGILLLAAVPFWIFYMAPQLTKLPDGFSYEALVFSRDNFYDEAKQNFSGQIVSNTKFSYDVVDKKDGILIIKNLFDVRTFEGKKIFAVERLYGIDPITRKHVAGYGDENREGYLIAPKGLKKGQEFTYWHINYDNPADLKFKEEEIINGLSVYRYETDYHADQTKNLGFLPGVPKERGINLDINLQLWVEPVTGRMIKYEDKTIAYYYNISTGERIHPWNKFNNRFNEISIEKQVEIAKTEKFKIFLIETIIPILMGIIVVVLLIFYYRMKRKAN